MATYEEKVQAMLQHFVEVLKPLLMEIAMGFERSPSLQDCQAIHRSSGSLHLNAKLLEKAAQTLQDIIEMHIEDIMRREDAVTPENERLLSFAIRIQNQIEVIEHHLRYLKAHARMIEE